MRKRIAIQDQKITAAVRRKEIKRLRRNREVRDVARRARRLLDLPGYARGAVLYLKMRGVSKSDLQRIGLWRRVRRHW
ncbi:MAG: hypothetical protein JWL75_215 [Parcubacteria group bacterium]|nr:hypothetical protein [Parcubacteria group bacterium]